MYYRKHFVGSSNDPNTSAKEQSIIWGKSYTTSSEALTDSTQMLRNAILETLHEAGCTTAVLDQESHMIKLKEEDDNGLLVWTKDWTSTSSEVRTVIYLENFYLASDNLKTISISQTSGNNSYGVFTASPIRSYDFYVTVVGHPDSVLSIFITRYGVEYLCTVITFSNIWDCVTQSHIRYVSPYFSNTTLTAQTSLFGTIIDKKYDSTALTLNSNISSNDTTFMVYLPIYYTTYGGRYKIENTYALNRSCLSTVTSNDVGECKFYKIDGTLYWVPYNGNIIVKC